MSEQTTESARPKPGVIEHPLYMALADAHLTALANLNEARVRLAAVEDLLHEAAMSSRHINGHSYVRVVDLNAALSASYPPTQDGLT